MGVTVAVRRQAHKGPGRRHYGETPINPQVPIRSTDAPIRDGTHGQRHETDPIPFDAAGAPGTSPQGAPTQGALPTREGGRDKKLGQFGSSRLEARCLYEPKLRRHNDTSTTCMRGSANRCASKMPVTLRPHNTRTRTQPQNPKPATEHPATMLVPDPSQ